MIGKTGMPLHNKLAELKPELLKNLEQNILNFWASKTPDPENEGFFGLVNAQNEAVSNANKGVILNTRILWTFSSAYLHLQNDAYKRIAARAYRYISDYFLDKDSGGVYWELDYRGKPVNTRKQVYAQAFAIYSFVEYYKITRDENVLREAVELYHLIEKHSLDKMNHGYIEAFGKDWTEIHDLRLSEKDLNAPKTMNTHLHILEAYTNLYRVWKDYEIRLSLERLIILFLEKFPDEKGHLILFFDSYWNKIEDFCSYGHDIEFSWLITEAAQVLGDPGLLIRTRKVAVKVAEMILAEGMDDDGGLSYEYNYKTNKRDADRHWWVQAEAMVGFYHAYRVSGNEKFAEAVVRLWQFIDKYIVDHQNGEWYWKVDSKGEVSAGMEKAGFWKCPYHNSRAILELMQGMNEY